MRSPSSRASTPPCCIGSPRSAPARSTACPHNGAVVTLLAVCRSSHRESYFHIAMTAIVGPIVALVAVIVLAGVFGSF